MAKMARSDHFGFLAPIGPDHFWPLKWPFPALGQKFFSRFAAYPFLEGPNFGQNKNNFFWEGSIDVFDVFQRFSMRTKKWLKIDKYQEKPQIWEKGKKSEKLDGSQKMVLTVSLPNLVRHLLEECMVKTSHKELKRGRFWDRPKGT